MDDFIQKTLVYNISNKKFKYNNPGFEHIDDIVNSQYLDKCVIVNTGHGFFKNPDYFLNDSVNYNRQKIVKRANKLGVIFFMWEPLCLYSKSNNHLKLSFYQEFNHTVKDIYSYEIDEIIRFCEEANIFNYEIKICDYDYSNILLNSYPDVKISYEDLYIKTMKFKTNRPVNKVFKKTFICPNARYTPHRHLIMCYLSNKSGIYSWNFICRDETIKRITWLDKTHPYYKKIIGGNEILNTNNYNIDKFLPKKMVLNITDWESIGDDIDHINNNEFYKNVFCAVVNETRFAQPLANFSEKVLKPINYNLPFILVAPPYTLELLKSQGFKTFDKWWDESYDQEEDHSRRLYKIFDIIDYINNLDNSEIKKMYEEMIPTLLFNSNLLKNIEW